MNLPFLASFILFMFVLARYCKIQSERQKKQQDGFWANEHKANSVRRKSLDTLDYVQVPLSKLPMHVLTENREVAECMEIVTGLSTQPIVNLTGRTNTELKLAYGTANITALSAYDQNYTVLVRTLRQWADILYDNGYIFEARTLLEFAVSTGCDISHCYYRLAEIYAQHDEYQLIEELKERAQALPSINHNAIVRTLRESYP